MVTFDQTMKPQDMDFLVTLTLQKPEFKKARRRGLLIYGLDAALGFLFAVYSLLFSWNHGIEIYWTTPVLGCLGLLFLLLCIFVPANQRRRVLRGSLEKNSPMMFNTFYFEFREDGVAEFSVFEKSLTPWNSFRCWGTGDNYLFLERLDNTCILINRNDIPESDLQEIEALLRSQRVPVLELPDSALRYRVK